MKLAFVAAADCPHVVKLVNSMEQRGNSVTLYSLPDQKDANSEINAQVNIVYLAVPRAQNGFKKNIKQLQGALASGGFDAVCAFDMPTYGLMAAKAKAQRLLLISSGLDVYNCEKDGTKSQIKKSIKAAGAVCATAPNVITKIKEYYKKDDKAFFVTPFGVDMEKFVKKEVTKGDIPYIGSIKFLEPGNGVDVVISAFAKMLHKSETDAILKIVGSGSLESALKDQVKRLGIEEKVEFTGYVKNADMPDVINTMDVVVQMTPTECFGVSAVEAMACEVPVVSSDTFGSSEFMLESVTGYLVKAGNEETCANRMTDLIENKDARERMGKMAREDVLPLYALPACIDKFEQAVKSVTGNAV